MNIPDHLLPPEWYWVSHVLAFALLLFAIRRAAWAKMTETWRLNIWLGACVALMGLWSIKTGIKPGLNFHVLGATAVTLMFGWELALVALAIVITGITLSGMAGWEALSLNFLLMAAVPVSLSYMVFSFVDRKLPNHLFIYIFIDAFFGAALAIGLTGVVSSLVLGLAGTYTFSYLFSDYLPYYILMGWSEALLTGMAISLMAIYRPNWVATFDDVRYLQNH
jgi:uncharacterized membrane protein